MTAYDPQNPFAKILRGEFPSYKVYENDHVLAFLDIMPRCPGHTLVIPKAPARNILDISPDDYAHVARGAHKIAAAASAAFDEVTTRTSAQSPCAARWRRLGVSGCRAITWTGCGTYPAASFSGALPAHRAAC